MFDITGNLQDTKNFATSDVFNLGNSIRITKSDTNLGGGHTLLGELANLVDDFTGGDFQPRRRGPPVGKSGFGNTFTFAEIQIIDEN